MNTPRERASRARLDPLAALAEAEQRQAAK